LLDGDCGYGCDSDKKWRLTDGVASMLNENDFSFSMEASQQQMDRSLAEHSLDRRSASYWARQAGIPANELTTKIKLAMGNIIGTYQPYDKAQYFFGNDFGLKGKAMEDVQGPSGEMAASENYMAFYVNKTVPVEFWIDSFPQGFSCGKAAPPPSGSRFDIFLPVDCSEVAVKVAEMKGCRRSQDSEAQNTDDCFDFPNWT